MEMSESVSVALEVCCISYKQPCVGDCKSSFASGTDTLRFVYTSWGSFHTLCSRLFLSTWICEESFPGWRAAVERQSHFENNIGAIARFSSTVSTGLPSGGMQAIWFMVCVRGSQCFHVCPQVKIHKMEDSSNSKPFMVTSSLNFKVTTPSFYNQPKKFASVAPPRPKSLTPPSAPSPTPVGTGVIGRVGDLPPPPPSLCDGTFLIYPALALVESENYHLPPLPNWWITF